MKDQKIGCTVDCCTYNDSQCKGCKLDGIYVVNDEAKPTAHYCGNYKKKV